MKNTPFKMNGFSGFGNSPLKDTNPHTSGHTHPSPEAPKTGMMGTPTYYEKGYPKKNKRKNRRKDFKFTKVGKIFRSIFGGGGSRGYSSKKISCGPGGCK